MKKLCKLFALLLLLALSLSLLTGCHGRLVREGSAAEDLGEEIELPAVPESFDTAKKHEISFWAKNDTNKTQIAIYQKAIRDFEALYPNVTVKLRLYTDYGRIYNDVITNIATDTTPNVCVTYPDHIATYMTGQDVVVPLDGYFADPRYGLGGSELKFDSPAMDELVPEFLSECVLEGLHYAIPFMRSTEACYVNKTYVEALGYELPEILTWDFVWEVSEAAMAKNADGTFKVNGQKVMIPFIYKSTDNMMIQMLRQRGAGYSTADGNVLLFNDTTREILFTIAEHVKSGAFDTFKHISYPANFLNAGQCIFAVDSTAGATWMGSEAPLVDIPPDQVVEFETAVLPIPQYDVEHPQMISQGPSVCIFNKDDPQEVLASWLFAQYLLTNDVQIAYAETEGYVPVTRKAQSDAGYQDYLDRIGEDDDEHYRVKIEASELLMANTENTFVTPVFNGSTSVRDAAGQLIENVNKAVRRKTTVDEAYMDALYKEVISLYRLERGVNPSALPAGSRALLISLASVWVLIGAFALYRMIKKKQGKKSRNS
ncbi:MAG: extracellular solute-binding protein [Oscillospiraceae bacterium]|nr:extracellular solute-binding protein [Oscillospiraceae bacterium]